MQKYIVEGPALAKLLRENRIRVTRGELTFTPLVDGDEEKPEKEAADGDAAPVEDTKDLDVEDDKNVEPEDTKDAAPVEDTKDTEPEETKSPKKGKK